jgi:sulfur-oxidizing protein SoxA
MMPSWPGWLLGCWLALAGTQALAASAPEVPDARRSGASDMSAELQAMQADAALNPAMLWVQQGEELWSETAQPQHASGKGSCASCHGDARTSMRGVAARYPAFDENLQRPLNLAQRINQCRSKYQQLAPWKLEGSELLGLESYVALQSRGLPVQPSSDARLAAYAARGQQRYGQRMGQINLSCANCHDERAGLRLGGNLIPQAHPTGYPVYRLEWQGLGSLQRRLRNCLSGVRAELYPQGSLELVELELFLAQRAQGMAMEAPGVRP